MTKVHRLVVLIVDHDDIGAPSIVDVLQSTRFPNRCIVPAVIDIETREIEWSDDHPLNTRRTMKQAIAELFGNPEDRG